MKAILFDTLDSKQFNALKKLFPSPSVAVMYETMLYAGANKYASGYEGSTWAFLASEDGTTGFMYPIVDEGTTFDVSVDTNGYTNKAMDAVTFGASVSLMTMNHLSWALQDFPELSDAYYRMRDFIFDISEGKIETDVKVNGLAVCQFID